MSFTKKIVSVLQNRIGEKNTRDALYNCLEEAILKKIQIQYDIKNFIEFLKFRNVGDQLVRKLSREINQIIDQVNNQNIQDYEQMIENAYEKHLGYRTTLYRLEYSLQAIIAFIEKLFDPQIIVRIKNDIDITNLSSLPPNELFIELNQIFKKHTNRTYEFLQEKFDRNFIQPQIQNIYREWKRPKFIIRPEQLGNRTQQSNYNTNQKLLCPNCKRTGFRIDKDQAICTNCGMENSDYTVPSNQPNPSFLGGRIAASEDDPLVIANQRAEIRRNPILVNDLKNIKQILASIDKEDQFNTVKNFWEKGIFSFLLANNRRPPLKKKNYLYIYSILLVLKTLFTDWNRPIRSIELSASELGFEFDTRGVVKLLDQFFKSTQGSLFPDIIVTFKNLINPSIYDKLENVIRDPKIIKQVRKKTKSYQDIKLTKKMKEDILYDILKPYKKQLLTNNIILTRKYIKENLI